TPVFLDAFPLGGGAPLQTTALPITSSAGNRRLTLSGTATTEGALARNADGNYLTLAGYDAAPGTAVVSTTSTAAVNRVVARVDPSFTVDTSTAMTDGFSGGNVRGAVTDDGTRFWVSGTGSGLNGTGGVRLATLGNGGATTQLVATPDNARVPVISSGQLYISS